MFEGNPFYTDFSEKTSKTSIFSFSPQKTYNVKTKVYKDGSQNSTICRQDIFLSDQYKKHRENFFSQHYLEYENGQGILDVLSGNTSDQIIVNNQCLYQLGFISASECVSRNFAERQLSTACLRFAFSHDLNDVPRPTNSSGTRFDSLKRSKDKIFDYIMCNSWDWFFTGTIDPDKLDSLDFKVCLKPINKWFQNMVQNYSISYILVFELHPTSGRLHLHGLLREDKDHPLKLKLSGTKLYYGFKKPMKDITALKHGLDISKGTDVYNLKSWRFGWSTAIRTYGSPTQLAHYCTKYITKDSKKIFGRYFWHSRDLERPKIIYDNVDFHSCNLPEFHGYKFNYSSSDGCNVRK